MRVPYFNYKITNFTYFYLEPSHYSDKGGTAPEKQNFLRAETKTTRRCRGQKGEDAQDH